MTWTIREATDTERQRMALPWKMLLRTTYNSDPYMGGRRSTAMGRISMATWWIDQAMHAMVDEYLHVCDMVIAEHPEVPGEPLGWAAFMPEPARLFAVHVRDGARRNGIGSALMAYVLGVAPNPAIAIMTKAGRSLVRPPMEASA